MSLKYSNTTADFLLWDEAMNLKGSWQKTVIIKCHFLLLWVVSQV